MHINSNSIPYDEHLTFFIYFLGIKNVITTLDYENSLTILPLLTTLASLRSEFSVTRAMHETIPFPVIRTIPAITVFSDNIVISYHVHELIQAYGTQGIDVALFDAKRFIGKLAAEALRLGFLVRGGATTDKLHHSGGVVFGRAMVEAFNLESTIAIYPRVVLSHRLRSRLHPENPNVAKDLDGIFHLDYFVDLFFTAIDPDNSSAASFNAWGSSARTTISTKITQHEAVDDLKPLAKWVWFKSQFDAAREKIPKELFKDDFYPIGRDRPEV